MDEGETELTCIPDALSIRTLRVRYLGPTVPLTVKGWRDELYLQFAVHTKQRAVELGLMRALPWEDAVGTWRRRDDGDISQTLLADFHACRDATLAAANELRGANLKQIGDFDGV